MEKFYRIYTYQNLADTCRDPDDIVIEELGYFKELDEVKEIANNFIKTKFFHKDTILHETKTGFSATDFCSYGKSIIIETIKIN